jgi:hypothetical protein
MCLDQNRIYQELDEVELTTTATMIMRMGLGDGRHYLYGGGAKTARPMQPAAATNYS